MATQHSSLVITRAPRHSCPGIYGEPRHVRLRSLTIGHARRNAAGPSQSSHPEEASSGASADGTAGGRQHNWTQQRSIRRQARALLLDKQNSSRVSTAASKGRGGSLGTATTGTSSSNGSSSANMSAAVSAAPVLVSSPQVVGKGRTLNVSSARALVLDSAYRPINVVHWKRAVEWDVDQKAEVLDYYEPPACALSGRGVHLLPAVLRLASRNVNLHKLITSVSCTRRNVMVRDKFTCQYCGAKRDLTLDHLLPVSRGGKDTWTNLVTACATCNQKKGANLLQNMKHMQLRSQPREPTLWELGVVVGLGKGELNDTPAQWEPWIAHYRRQYDKMRQDMRAAGVEDSDDEEEEVEEEGEVEEEVEEMATVSAHA